MQMSSIFSDLQNKTQFLNSKFQKNGYIFIKNVKVGCKNILKMSLGLSRTYSFGNTMITIQKATKEELLGSKALWNTLID